MAVKTTPVLIYLPEVARPVVAGMFSWSSETRVGKFRYDAQYLDRGDAIPIDPMKLRFARSEAKEVRQDGIFGIFRDAGPDAWGRDQLFRQQGNLDDFDLLLCGPGDHVGNLCFGELPKPLSAFTLAEIDEVSKGFPPEGTLIENAIIPTTSMGGAKPKLLVEDAGEFWIAKFPEKGDPLRFLAINEHAMLEMAHECHIDTAKSRLHTLPDGRQIILVKRFDLERTDSGVLRNGFASAHTILGMGNPMEDGRRKSYLRFSDEVRRWTGEGKQFEIWKRLVFNALVGNIDDHARNHALIRDAKGWRLSPAFDIVAGNSRDPVVLAMQIHQDPTATKSLANPQTLLFSAINLGIEVDSAIQTLKSMASTIASTWRERLIKLGGEPESIERIAASFRLADTVVDHDYGSEPLPGPRRRCRPW